MGFVPDLGRAPPVMVDGLMRAGSSPSGNVVLYHNIHRVHVNTEEIICNATACNEFNIPSGRLRHVQPPEGRRVERQPSLISSTEISGRKST